MLRSCASGSSGGSLPTPTPTNACGGLGVARKAPARCRGPALTLERLRDGTRSHRRWLVCFRAPPFPGIPDGLRACLGRDPTPLRGRQFHSGATSFRQSDGNGLLWRLRPVLPFADVVQLFANKLARLSAGRFSFLFIVASALDHLFFRHCAPLSWA